MMRLAAIALLLLGGCELEPFCVTCADGGGLSPMGRYPSDASPDARVVPDATFPDAVVTCVPLGDEACNEIDDDCDGLTDEGFDFSSDLFHCGGCGQRCELLNADVACNEGRCEMTECLPGFADLDGEVGCEQRCPVFPIAGESCNGVDDDCDGAVDEADGLAPPPDGLCRTTPGTLCEGVGPVCATREGVTTWFCDYPEGVEFDETVPNGIALEETRCDGVDGDCDGVRDEVFAELGAACDNGARGACRDVGVVACDPDDAGRTACDLSVLPDPTPDAPFAEICNGQDDDCDGIVDNSDPDDPARVRDDLVHVDRGGADFYVYRHEASRPDADGASAGVSNARSCSRAGVVPWTSVGIAEARSACEAAGFRLCTGDEWQLACAGDAGGDYPYSGAYDGDRCNGADRSAEPALMSTGALAECASQEGALDLSGNVKEWTEDQRGTSSAGREIYVIRGGSYESPELGLTCGTVLARATADSILPGLGFRCCSDHAP